MKYIKIVFISLILQMAFAPLAYTQDGEDVTKYTIREYLEANLPPQESRKIVLDEITGLLTITDTPRNQALALKLIREWDVGPKQIQIEAKFIEITFTDLNELGVDWQTVAEEQHSILDFATWMMGDSSTTSDSTALLFKSAQEAAGLGFFAGKASLTGTQLLTYLKALEQSGKANLLNAPRITTLSGQMANIQVVRSFPYATSAERTQVEYGELGDYYDVETYEIEEEITGITLEVTPTVIEGSDIITLEIHPEVTKLSSQVDITGSAPDNLGWPIIDARVVQTTVMVRSGETIIMGGLIQDEDDGTIERKIPVLGDIPLIGSLFRYKYEKRAKKNLVIFLTARLLSTRGEEIR